MKHGFMLIELVVVTLISSIVAGILLTALSQSSRFQITIDNIVDTSLRIGIVSNQLEKDLMGAFVPVQAELSPTQDEGEDQDEMADIMGQMQQSDSKKPDDKKSGDKKDAKKEKQKPLEKIFFATHKEGNLDTLTFITNNPLVVFVGKDVGVVKPKIVRVQYTLKPEVDKPKSYALYRQESNELDLAEYKNVRSYEVIGGIKSLSVDYTARIEKKTDAAKAAEGQHKEKPKVAYEYKTSNDWVSERKKEGDKDKEQEFPRVPHSVEIKIELWDRQDKREKEFTVVCEIPVDSIPAKKPVEPKKPEPAAAPSLHKASEGKQMPSRDELSAAVIKPMPQSGQQLAFNSRSRDTVVAPLKDMESLAKTLENLSKMLSQM